MENEDNKSQSMSVWSKAKIAIGVLCLISSAFFLLGLILSITDGTAQEIEMAGHVIMILFTIVLPFIIGVILVFKR